MALTATTTLSNETTTSYLYTVKALNAFALTTSDTTGYNLPVTVYVGGTGNVAIIPAQGPSTVTVTFTGVPAGTLLPVQVRAIMATGDRKSVV